MLGHQLWLEAPATVPRDLHLDVALDGTKGLGAWSDGRLGGRILE